jgi:hypothetical protein
MDIGKYKLASADLKKIEGKGFDFDRENSTITLIKRQFTH